MPRARTGLSSREPLLAALILGIFLLPACGKAGDGDASASDSTQVEASRPTDQNSDVTESDDASSADEGDEKASSSRAEKTTSVMACRAVRGNLVIPVVAEGRIRARRETDIRAEIAGSIERLFVEEGSTVRKGAIIARLDGREHEVAIAEAHSRYLESLGQLVVEDDGVAKPAPENNFQQRLEDLWKQERDGTISRNERVAAERQVETEAIQQGAYRRELVEARTGLAAARADKERAKLNLEHTEIRAPFAGVIHSLTINPGERLTAGQILCGLVDNQDVEAEVGVLESDLRGLEVGRPALLAVPALGETLQAKVDVINPTIDADTRTCTVLLRYDSRDGRVRPGMFVRALVAGRTFPDRLLVPREAILTRDSRPLLFRIDDGRARWVYVELGAQNDNVVEIANVIQGGPLEEGSEVIVSDHLTLTENAKVKVSRYRGLRDPWALAASVE